MDRLCTSCGDVSKNLHQIIIAEELDFTRASIGQNEYIWRCNVSSIVRAAAHGCTFCSFVNYVFLQPYYDPQSLEHKPTSKAPTVEDLSDEAFRALRMSARDAASLCLVCSGHASRAGRGLCHRCEPRVARYLAAHCDEASQSGFTGILPLSITIRKTSWEMYEDAHVQGLSLECYLDSNRDRPLNMDEESFRLDCLGDDPAAVYVDQRPRLYRFDDSQIYEQVRSLLKKCADNHDCGPEYPVRRYTRPARLVDLGQEGTGDPVKLSNGATSEPYVALSYCWGGRQPLLTKNENLVDHQRAIPVSLLAQSIKDAMTLTKELGIRFLWVDSLCIIQNDKQDKASEIGKMRNVYANSYLTICAGRARAATDGFLSIRTDPFRMDTAAREEDPHHDNSSQIAKAQSRNPKDIWGSLPIMLPSGETGSINIRRMVEYSSRMEPLAARAWTYEERLLSKRIVTFGQCVTWRCFDSHCLLADTGDYWLPEDEENLDALHGEPHATALQFKHRWHNLVTTYSKRSMYDEADKLPAIAGIVQQMQPDSDPKAYLAGLWTKQMGDDLMWFVPNHGTKPSKWRAPSWSWASLNGEVQFQGAADAGFGSRLLISDVVSDIQLYSEASPFGELRSASLHVTGYICLAERGLVARKSPYRNAPVSLREVFCTSADPPTTIHEGISLLWIDVAEDSLRHPGDEEYVVTEADHDELLRSEPVWCLLLNDAVAFEPDQPSACEPFTTRLDGLLLRKNENGTYQRIGIFEAAKYDDGRYFSWGEPERIHLV